MVVNNLQFVHRLSFFNVYHDVIAVKRRKQQNKVGERKTKKKKMRKKKIRSNKGVAQTFSLLCSVIKVKPRY